MVRMMAQTDLKQIDLKLITEWLKILGGIVVFGLGLFQYARAQKWKRREFIASQIKDFEADIKIQLAMTMLDWNERRLYFPAKGGDGFVPILVNEALLRSSFLPHENAIRYFQNEVLIRDCFDRFFDMLVRLSDFVEADLISVDELRPYLQYWIKLISGNKRGWHSPELFILLLNHIDKYDFEKAAQLIRNFGYDPVPSKVALEEAIKKTLEMRHLGEEADFQRTDETTACG